MSAGPLASVQHNGGWSEPPACMGPTDGTPTRGCSTLIANHTRTGNSQPMSANASAVCLPHWLGGGNTSWDVVAIGLGAYDACHGASPSSFAQHVGQIYRAATASLSPNGTLLWVTSVPRGSGGTECGMAASAFDAKLEELNSAAVRALAAKPNVEVLDLHAAVARVCGGGGGGGYSSCNLQRHHNIHLTSAGKQYAAIQVAHAIAPLLAPRWSALCHKMRDQFSPFGC
eukprot:SAG11_NODE_210_length_12303_cov_10.235824_8_plen_229_part_00